MVKSTDLGPLPVRTPLGLFTALWAVGAALHTLEDKPMGGILTYPLALMLLFNPERLWAIAAFGAGHAALMSLHLPDPANHSLLAMFVDLGLVIGSGIAWLRREKIDPLRALWDAVRGPFMALLAVIYFFAVFHKLNSSFFDPSVSCAVSQPLNMMAMHGFSGWTMSSNPFAFNIYITIVVEIAILALLLTKRYTHVGALLGFAFHIGLGWARFYDFATVAFAMYLFFFPWSEIEARLARVPRWAGTSFLAGMGTLAMGSIVFYGVRGDPVIVKGVTWSFTVDTIMCFAWTFALVPLLLPVFRNAIANVQERRWVGNALAWVIPLIAAVNGATSYLGLKTVANYSMFSNLRTEGGQTNHFIVPASRLFVADYQLDIVRVEKYQRIRMGRRPFRLRFVGDGSPRWRQDLPAARVPFVELQRTVQRWKDVGIDSASIAYERGGKRFDIEKAFADSALMHPLNFFERNFMAFRAVPPDGSPSPCRW